MIRVGRPSDRARTGDGRAEPRQRDPGRARVGKFEPTVFRAERSLLPCGSLGPPHKAALEALLAKLRFPKARRMTGSGSRRLPQQPLRAGHIGGRGRRFAPAYLLELFNARPSRRALPPVHADEGIELGAEELGHVRTDRLPRERWTLHAPNLGKAMCRNRVRTPAEVSGFDGGRPRHMGEAPAPTTCAPTDLRIEGGGEDLRNVRSTA